MFKTKTNNKYKVIIYNSNRLCYYENQYISFIIIIIYIKYKYNYKYICKNIQGLWEQKM